MDEKTFKELAPRLIVVGRPILLAKKNDEGRPQNLREAVERTLDEFADVL